ncbi:MAG: hypothetical protein QM786_10120 [Breznakibacter sp.]
MKTPSTIIIAIAMAVLAISAKAQYPMALYHLENLPQSQFLNPAHMPRANGFFGIPLVNSIQASFNSDVAFNERVPKNRR